MRTVSQEFHRTIQQNSKTLFGATVTLANGTAFSLTGNDVMLGTVTFSEATSSQSSFDVGAAIIGKFSVTLDNHDGRYSEYDFEKATIIPQVGVKKANNTTEWLRKGVYTVEQPESLGTTITLEGVDNMHKLENELFDDVSISFPNTLYQVVSAICAHCGLSFLQFDNSNYVITSEPQDTDSMTCLQAISYIAQLAGCWATVDNYGRLTLKWYNTSAFNDGSLDGGQFDSSNPHSSGDTADGGNFTNYSSGATADGGAFAQGSYIVANSFTHATISTDDVVITGVKVTAADDDDGDGETYTYGADGYVLEILGNPFIQRGKAQAAAQQIGLRVVGMQFRPFDISIIGDPSYEAGDPILVIDRDQNQYKSYVTAITYKMGAYQSLSCKAKYPGRNQSAMRAAITNALIKSRRHIRREQSAREIAQRTLALMLANASGLYKTEETQDDGSVIYYLHDKSSKAQSSTIWKATADAFGVSTDGGTTYSYGVDANGVAILNRIYAIGLDADYITTGALTVSEGNKEIFRADVRSGTFKVDTDNFSVTTKGVITAKKGTIGGFTITTTSIYSGPTSLDDNKGSSDPGVYVGIDGIMSSAVNAEDINGKLSTKLTGGGISGYQSTGANSSVKVGSILPSLQLIEGGQVKARGVAIEGGAISLYTDYIVVKSATGNNVVEGVTYAPPNWSLHTNNEQWAENNDVITLAPSSTNIQFVKGIAVMKSTGNVMLSKSVYTSAKVDALIGAATTSLQQSINQKADSTTVSSLSSTVTSLSSTVSSLQTQIGTKADSSTVTALSTALDNKSDVGHTHEIEDVNYLATRLSGIPTFELIGNDLYITIGS